MQNNNKDWRDYNLDEEEIELLESIEAGEWKSSDDIDFRKNQLRDFFTDGKQTKNSINISLEKDDFDVIINKSKQYGMNYKELLEKLIHNFAAGKIAL